jgi:DNA-binding transcriptional MerR regulator
MNPVQEDRLLPINEAAERLDLSLDTLRRWDRLGEDAPLRPVRRTGGGTRLYSEVEVEALREKRGVA